MPRSLPFATYLKRAPRRALQIAGAGTKVYTDFHAAINDPDVNAVVVTTPGAFHKDPVIAAIKAGKPVFSEKPLANTAADCKEIVDAEMASGKHLVQVGFMRRYDRGYKQVKELLDSGKFGAPMVIKCTHRADGVAPDYTTAMAVTDTAIHEIDVLPWLVDDEWDEVQCIMPKTSSKAHEGLKDPQIMIMKTKGGIVTVLEVNVNCGFGYDINCEVVCENGVINLPCPSFPTVRFDHNVSTKIEDNWILRFIDSYDVEIQDWVDHASRVRPAARPLGTAMSHPSPPTRWSRARPPASREGCHRRHPGFLQEVKGEHTMKIGFNEGCNRFCENHSVLEDLDLCEKYGFDYIDIQSECLDREIAAGKYTIDDLAAWFADPHTSCACCPTTHWCSST